MNLADVFTVVLVILGFQIMFVGVWLMAAGLFPAVVGRCADRIGTVPVKCAAVGVACLVPLFTGGILLGKIATNAPLKFLSVMLIVASILAALFGTAGLALRIGQGMASTRDHAEPWRRGLRGGIVLALSFLTVVLLPLTLVAGFGALVLSRSGRSAPVPPADPLVL